MRIAYLALRSSHPVAAGMARAQDYLSCQLAPGWTQSEAVHGSTPPTTCTTTRTAARKVT
jgi:hypothetical protein